MVSSRAVHHAARRGRVVRAGVVAGAWRRVGQEGATAPEEALDGPQDCLVLARRAAHDVFVAHRRAGLRLDRVVLGSRVGVLVAGVAGRRLRRHVRWVQVVLRLGVDRAGVIRKSVATVIACRLPALKH